MSIESKKYFRDVTKIKYEGKDSNNSLVFKYYSSDEVIGEKTMKEYLR